MEKRVLLYQNTSTKFANLNQTVLGHQNVTDLQQNALLLQRDQIRHVAITERNYVLKENVVVLSALNGILLLALLPPKIIQIWIRENCANLLVKMGRIYVEVPANLLTLLDFLQEVLV